jgi:hypothetical protein
MAKIKWDTELARKAINDKWKNKLDIIEPFTYTNVDTKINMLCKIHGQFNRSLYEILNRKYPCPKCSPTGPKGWDFIKKELYNTHGDRYNYNLMDNGGYKPNTALKIICYEHGLFQQSLSEHKKGSNCPKCVDKEKRKTVNDFLYESIKNHGSTYSYENIFLYFNTYNTKIPIICKKHGEFWQRAGDHSRGSGCSRCNSPSKGELQIKRWLLDNRIPFEIEKTFLDFKTPKGSYYRFDFYLPEHRILLEYDGIQHHKPTLFNNYDTNSQINIDNIKTKYAQDNGYKLIRINNLKEISDKLSNEDLK